MYKLIDGKKVSEELRQELKEEISKLDKKPELVVILIGEDPASKVYVNTKERKCKEVGIISHKYELSEDISEKEVLNLIDKLNKNPNINGILVQMPLPKHISSSKIMEAVIPEKDVDGFNPKNIGDMVLGKSGLRSCTPKGVIKLLKYYNINLEGKDIVVIGKSIIVGTPMALLLLEEDATVSVCHLKTKDLESYTKKADIVVSATGKKHLITSEMIKEGAVVIDVGTIKENGKLYGDVDFDNVKDKTSYITPVPDGVGPMTIACLLENTLMAYKLQKEKGI